MEENKKPVKVGSWLRQSTRQVYDNPWISVHHDEVITPGGSQGIYGRVQFKNKAVGIIPLDEENHTWIVGQYRYSLAEYSWEIPMGGSPEGVDPLVTAQCELREETGLTASTWRQLLRLHPSNSVTNEEGFVFLAKDLSQGSQALEDTEDIQVKRLSIQDVVQMVKDGRITDAISVAGLLRIAMELGVSL